MLGKVAVVGAGALGSYLGIRLADAGADVRFLVRNNASALRRIEWRVVLDDGEIIKIPHPKVSDDPAEIGVCQFVLIALKATHNDALPSILPDLVGPSTIIQTIQNGLGNVEAIADVCPRNPVLAGLCQIGVNRTSPGEVKSFVPGGGFMQLGKHGKTELPKMEQIKEAWESAGLKVHLVDPLGEALWKKLMWNVPFNGLPVLCRKSSTHYVMESPELRATATTLMEELREAAGCEGFAIPSSYVDRLLGFTDKLGVYKPSSVTDVESGQALELEAIWGEPLRRGQFHGVAMPLLQMLYGTLGLVGTPDE